MLDAWIGKWSSQRTPLSQRGPGPHLPLGECQGWLMVGDPPTGIEQFLQTLVGVWGLVLRLCLLQHCLPGWSGLWGHLGSGSGCGIVVVSHHGLSIGPSWVRLVTPAMAVFLPSWLCLVGVNWPSTQLEGRASLRNSSSVKVTSSSITCQSSIILSARW